VIALDIRNLTKQFGEFRAVDSVALTVGTGEVVGLLGANGAGKTTLIRMALGLLRPTSGEVRIFGEISGISVRRRIGYLPQGLGLYEDLTVRENLEFVARAFGVPAAAIGSAIEDRDRLVGDLSLGARRRVAFQAAFLHSPELLVLDEPTSGVGPLARTQLWDGIRSAAANGSGVLVTTHHMNEAEQCDRVVLMAAGRVVASGSVKELVGGASVVEVQAESWAKVFNVLDRAGFALSLRGRRVRVLQAEAATVRAVLAENDIRAVISVEPATFDEAFVTLTAAA
jgi:ABC-2 type transport system ATP-binding protein